MGEGSAKSMARPYAVTVAPNGLLAVADPGAGSLNIFNLVTNTHLSVTQFHRTPLRSPVGVAADAQNRFYVADSVNRRVYVFSESGEPEDSFGGALGRPTGVAVDRRRGVLYVADTARHRIHARSVEGRYLFGFGERGKGPGQFNYPTHLFYSRRMDRLLVCDTLNFRIQIMDRRGRPESAFGRLGDATGYMARPKGVAVNSQGHIFVADALYNVVQIFDQRGRLLLYFGRAGNGKGDLAMPAGLYIDDKDRIYVANTLNRRVEIFQQIGGSR